MTSTPVMIRRHADQPDPGTGPARLHQDALGRRGHHVQLMQDLLVLPGLARVIPRPALRYQQVACQQRHADQAEPPDHGCPGTPGAPAGDPLR